MRLFTEDFSVDNAEGYLHPDMNTSTTGNHTYSHSEPVNQQPSEPAIYCDPVSAHPTLVPGQSLEETPSTPPYYIDLLPDTPQASQYHTLEPPKSKK